MKPKFLQILYGKAKSLIPEPDKGRVQWEWLITPASEDTSSTRPLDSYFFKNSGTENLIAFSLCVSFI